MHSGNDQPLDLSPLLEAIKAQFGATNNADLILTKMLNDSNDVSLREIRQYFGNKTGSLYAIGVAFHYCKKHFNENVRTIDFLMTELQKIIFSDDITDGAKFINIAYIMSGIARFDIDLKSARPTINKLSALALHFIERDPEFQKTTPETIGYIFSAFLKWKISAYQKIDENTSYQQLIVLLIKYLIENMSEHKNNATNLVLLFFALSKWNFSGINYQVLYQKINNVKLNSENTDFLVTNILSAIAKMNHADSNEMKKVLLEKCLLWLEHNDFSANVAIISLRSLLMLHHISQLGEDPAKSKVGKKLIEIIRSKKSIKLNEKLMKQLSEISIFINDISISEFFPVTIAVRMYDNIERYNSKKSQAEVNIFNDMEFQTNFKLRPQFDKKICHGIDGVINLPGIKIAIEVDGDQHFFHNIHTGAVDFSQPTSQTIWRNFLIKRLGYELVIISNDAPFEHALQKINELKSIADKNPSKTRTSTGNVFDALLTDDSEKEEVDYFEVSQQIDDSKSPNNTREKHKKPKKRNGGHSAKTDDELLAEAMKEVEEDREKAEQAAHENSYFFGVAKLITGLIFGQPQETGQTANQSSKQISTKTSN